MKEKTRNCPYDKAQLSVQSVPVMKRNGISKKLNMLVCPYCRKRYIVENSIPQSVDISEFYVVGKAVVTHDSKQSGKPDMKPSSNCVYSPKYGEGQIESRTVKNGKTYICIKFGSKTITLDETVAFSKKALVRK